MVTRTGAGVTSNSATGEELGPVRELEKERELETETELGAGSRETPPPPTPLTGISVGRFTEPYSDMS